MTLDDVNGWDRRRFVEELGWVFEHSPWVAERAWNKRPFTTVLELHAAMVDEVRAASPEEQVALLRAHPDLGRGAGMSQASASEQSAAGLDRLSAEEIQRLRQLNTDYRAKFSFPFLYAVKGSTKQDILRSLEARLPEDRDSERAEALEQVCRIARFRLEESIT